MKKIYKNDKYLRGLYRENKQWKISVWFAILGFSGWKYQNEIFCKVTLGIWLSCKESACNAEDAGSIPGSGRSHNPWVRKIPWRRAWQPTHSSILAWRIPWTEELGGLQSIASPKVRHDWSDWALTHKILNIADLCYTAGPYLFYIRQVLVAYLFYRYFIDSTRLLLS